MSRKDLITLLLSEAGDLSAEVLGNKGYGLAQMVKAGLPVPPGFVIITGTSRAFRQEGQLPKRLAWQVRRAITLVEKQTGKKFGGDNPLLFSVRSGAQVSMPGMMDTVLNLGLNQQTLQGLIRASGNELFSYSTYARFLRDFGTTVLGINKDRFEEVDFGNVEALRNTCQKYRQIVLEQTGQEMIDDPWQQLMVAIEAICRSWNNERAVAYRHVHQIASRFGTAVVVQTMVFGNSTGMSGTGVVFSRNVATGANELYGEFLRHAQGEDLVAGAKTPESIDKLDQLQPQLFEQLAKVVRSLERSNRNVVDVEFTIEGGKLWLLQVRTAKQTPIAAVRIAVDMVSEGLITRKEAVGRIDEEALKKSHLQEFEPSALTEAIKAKGAIKGLAASPGAAVGIAVFDPTKAIELVKAGRKVVLIRKETSPDDFEGMMAAEAIVTAQGGQTCHAAVVARAMGKPAVVGTRLSVTDGHARCADGLTIMEGYPVSVDGSSGVVIPGVSINLMQDRTDGKLEVFLSWVDQYRPRPKINPQLAQQTFDVNRILADFYISSFLANAARSTSLEAEFRQFFRQITKEAAEVFATYLIIAIAGEARHANSSGQGPELSRKLDRMQDLGLTKLDRESTQKSALERLSQLGREAVVEFASLAADVFNYGPIWGWTAYGGAKWGDIAATVRDYLMGRIRAELFVDRVFDLRHNGGRLFDKHPMVISRTDESMISRELEVKRTTTSVNELVSRLTSITNVSSETLRKYRKWTEYEERKKHGM